MSKINVLLLFGGRSSEHDVSVTSAGEMLSILRSKEAFSIYPVEITVEGNWMAVEDISPYKSPDKGTQVQLEVSSGGTVELRTVETRRSICTVDLVLPVLHGSFGEDGVIQGFLEELGVPYVGCGVASSACAMDKDFTKRLLRSDGFPVANGVTLYENRVHVDDVRGLLELPIFVKPATGGSSIGVSRVKDWNDLQASVSRAFASSHKVIVEPEIPGAEVEVGVLEFPDGSVRASVPAQLNGTTDGSEGFYDYESKYSSDVVSSTIPAEFPRELTEQLQATAISVFKSLGCRGLARVDFFVSPQQIFINEVNTMPGFTRKSMFPLVWKESGVPFEQLLDILLHTALGKDKVVADG